MNISVVAGIADLAAALGVIASLIFLALQIRQNTETVKNSHWEATLQRDNTHTARTLDEHVANIVQKGRKSYSGLTDSEKLVFESWIYEWTMVYEGLTIFSTKGILRPEVKDVADQELEWYFCAPGVREWYLSENRRPITSDLAVRIDKVIPSATSVAATS